MSKFSEDDIVDFWKDCGLSLTRDNLLRPNKDFVIRLYVQILKKMDYNNLEQPDIMACTNKNQVDNMADGIFLINIYQIVNKIVISVGLVDLKFEDIVLPKRARTNRILCALSIFYIRYSEMKNMFLEQAEKYAENNQRKQMLKSQIIELNDFIENKSMLVSSLKNKSSEEKKDKLNTLVEKLNDDKREAEILEKKTNEFKVKISSQNEYLCQIELEINELENQITKMKQLIISSPEKIIEAKNDLEKRLKAIKDNYPALKACEKNLLDINFLYKTGENVIKEPMMKIKELIDLKNKNEDECLEMEEVIKNTKKLEQTVKELEIERKGVEMAHHQLISNMKKDNAKYLREAEICEELLKGLKKESEKRDTKIELTHKRIDELEKKKQKLNEEMQSIEVFKENLFQRYQEIYQRLEEKIITLLNGFDATAN